MLIRLGESGLDALTVMRTAGRSQKLLVSQRYIQPTPEAVERAFEGLQLAGQSLESRLKRLPPAAESATLAGVGSVSH